MTPRKTRRRSKAPCYRPEDVLRILCNIVATNAGGWPAIVEAHFVDAGGNPVVIRDKAPIFIDEGDEPGEGAVCCTELSRETRGDRTVVTVSLGTPDGLATTDGRTVVEVLDTSLEAAV